MNNISPSRSRREVAAAGLVAAIAVCAVAGLGTLGTDLGPWYQGLRQPAWKPPDLWFGPAWTLVFSLIGWAAARAWLRARDAAERTRLLWAWAQFEVLPFWLSIIGLIVLVRRTDKSAAALLLPYLAWVTFAAALNHAVVRLNSGV
jgi:benzodiazapine receptor